MRIIYVLLFGSLIFILQVSCNSTRSVQLHNKETIYTCSIIKKAFEHKSIDSFLYISKRVKKPLIIYDETSQIKCKKIDLFNHAVVITNDELTYRYQKIKGTWIVITSIKKVDQQLKIALYDPSLGAVSYIYLTEINGNYIIVNTESKYILD